MTQFPSIHYTAENTLALSSIWLGCQGGVIPRHTSLIFVFVVPRVFLLPFRSSLLVDRVQLVFPTNQRVSHGFLLCVRTYSLRVPSGWDTTKVPLMRIEEGVTHVNCILSAGTGDQLFPHLDFFLFIHTYDDGIL